MIYKVAPSLGRSFAILPDLVELMEQFDEVQEALLRASWTPRRVEVVTENKGISLAPVDIYLGGGTPWLIVNERALGALRDVLERNGEVLPLRSTGSVGFRASLGDDDLALHRTQVVDCLDVSRSEVDYWPGSDKVRKVRTPVLDLDRLGGAEMFVLPQVRGVILVTQAFLVRVKECSLLGLEFKPYFDADPARNS